MTRARLFASHVAGFLVFSQAHEPRVTEMPVRRPFDELEFSDEVGPQPAGALRQLLCAEKQHRVDESDVHVLRLPVGRLKASLHAWAKITQASWFL